MKFGDVVTFIDRDGSEKPTLVVGVRTDTELGKNNEPLLSLGFFKETSTFGAPESTVLHDIPHQSHEPENGDIPRERRRWKAVGEVEPKPEHAQAAAAESGEQIPNQNT